jgi:hypothetical protein
MCQPHCQRPAAYSGNEQSSIEREQLPVFPWITKIGIMNKAKPHLYCRELKTKTSWFTQVEGKYIPLGSDKAVAERRLAELMHKGMPDTVASMCRSYIKEQRELLAAGDPNSLSPATIDDYEVSLEKHVMPVFGKMRPADFKPSYVAQFLNNARKAKRGIRANRDMAALGSAFNHGMVLGLVEANPCRGVKRNKERARTRSVSIAEFNVRISGHGGQRFSLKADTISS